MSVAPKEIIERLLRERKNLMIQDEIPFWREKHAQNYRSVLDELLHVTLEIEDAFYPLKLPQKKVDCWVTPRGQPMRIREYEGNWNICSDLRYDLFKYWSEHDFLLEDDSW